MNLLLLALQGKVNFTYGNTGKKIEDAKVLIEILNMFAELDLLVNNLSNVKKDNT